MIISSQKNRKHSSTCILLKQAKGLRKSKIDFIIPKYMFAMIKYKNVTVKLFQIMSNNSMFL